MSGKFILFILVLSSCLFLQSYFFWRKEHRTGKSYWKMFFSHLLLVGIGNILIRAVQVLGLGTVLFLDHKAWLLDISQFTGQHAWVQVVVSILLLDLAVYWQHRLAHIIPFIWRFHRVHHADQQMEASSGIRFHPIEILFSFYYKLLFCRLLGITMEAYLWFEMVLMSSALFNHSNLRLPLWLEKVLSSVIVTPRIHFVHHSVQRERMNMNYGFFLSLWDRLFGSFMRLPEAELTTMPLGVKGSNPQNILELLKEPFRGE